MKLNPPYLILKKKKANVNQQSPQDNTDNAWVKGLV